MSLLYEAKASEALTELGLTTAADQLDSVAQKAAASKWSYSHFLGYLLSGELSSRQQRTMVMNTRFAHFPYRKRLEDFDFTAQPSVDPKLIEELSTLRCLAEGRNVVLLGPPGVGKTHLAIALAVKVIEAGSRCLLYQRHGRGSQTGRSDRAQPPSQTDRKPDQDSSAHPR